MHWGWEMGFLPLFPLFWIGVIALLCWGVSHWSGLRNQPAPPVPPFEANALEILRRRYARGEIDGATFDQMRERLESSGRPRD